MVTLTEKTKKREKKNKMKKLKKEIKIINYSSDIQHFNYFNEFVEDYFINNDITFNKDKKGNMLDVLDNKENYKLAEEHDLFTDYDRYKITDLENYELNEVFARKYKFYITDESIQNIGKAFAEYSKEDHHYYHFTEIQDWYEDENWNYSTDELAMFSISKNFKEFTNHLEGGNDFTCQLIYNPNNNNLTLSSVVYNGSFMTDDKFITYDIDAEKFIKNDELEYTTDFLSRVKDVK